MVYIVVGYGLAINEVITIDIRMRATDSSESGWGTAGCETEMAGGWVRAVHDGAGTVGHGRRRALSTSGRTARCGDCIRGRVGDRSCRCSV